MRAKNEFVMRSVVDEYIIMPPDDNINRFDGSVVLNEVSAFVWEKLEQETTREAILEALLNEFDVAQAVAEKDLDVLLNRFREYGLIEE